MLSQVKRFVPPKLRRLRGEWLEAMRGDQSHDERAGRRDFLRRAFRAVAFNGISGDYAEFGCCGGQTFGMAHQASRKAGLDMRLWAFDSFQGLPAQAMAEDEHPVWVEGDMSVSLTDFHAICSTYGMKPNDYVTVPGFYDATLGDVSLERADRPRDIAIAYVDCDLYSSTCSVLNFLRPRLKHGMIVAFDDYFCWSATAVSGERNACEEFWGDDPEFRLAPYLTFGWHGMSYVVERRRLLKSGIRLPDAQTAAAVVVRAEGPEARPTY